MTLSAGTHLACVAVLLCSLSDEALAMRVLQEGIDGEATRQNASRKAARARTYLRNWLVDSARALRPSPSGLIEKGARYNEPSPKSIILNFELVDFASAAYAEQMLKEGCDLMSEEQQVYQSLYTDGLLHDAIDGVDHIASCDKTQHEGKSQYTKKALDILHHLPPLSEAVLYNSGEWKHDELAGLDQALELIKKEAEQDVKEDDHCKELHLVLEKIESGFYREMHTFQRKFYYLGVTDGMVAKYGKKDPKGLIHVQLSQIRGMHTLDTVESRAKSDKRRDASFGFFKMLFEENLAGHSVWDLDDMLEKHGTDEAKWALESQTPMMAFRVEDGEVPGVPGPVYVLSEGNGRLGGLLAALDQVRAIFPNFCEPRLGVEVTNFAGPAIARKNWLFFLRINWRNQFPGHPMEGWTPAVPDSVRPLSKEEIEVIESRPRYFGYRPL